MTDERVNNIEENDMAANDIDRRLERMEKRLDEIQAALTGNYVDGTLGLVGRVRDRERMAENHDLRIVSLEREQKRFVDKREFEELEKKVEVNTEWRQRLTWMVAGAATGGGVAGGGIVAVLLQVFGA